MTLDFSYGEWLNNIKRAKRRPNLADLQATWLSVTAQDISDLISLINSISDGNYHPVELVIWESEIEGCEVGDVSLVTCPKCNKVNSDYCYFCHNSGVISALQFEYLRFYCANKKAMEELNEKLI